MIKLILVIFMVGFSWSSQAKSKSKKRYKSKKPSLRMISYQKYSRFSPKRKKIYINQIRNAVYHFEKRQKRKFKSAKFSLQDFLIPRAYAMNSDWCVVGGRARKFGCTLLNNQCRNSESGLNGQEKSFQCGVIYGSACVHLNDDNVTDRCRSAARNDFSEWTENARKNFLEARETLRRIEENVCSGNLTGTRKINCGTTAVRFNFQNSAS